MEFSIISFPVLVLHEPDSGKLLRHKNVKTTLASYVAETPQEVREAIDKVSEGFQKPEDFESRIEEKVM